MDGQIEAAAAFATAALAADSLDPPSPRHGAPGAACANCTAPLAGPFCGQCGQRAHLHRSIGEVFHEFLHGITHFDSKAWTTLPTLLFRPGRLTRSYIDGQRARYVAPVPLFLMVIFLMFFVFSFVSVTENIDSAANSVNSQMTAAQAAARLPGIDAELQDLDRQIAAAKSATGRDLPLAGLLATRNGVNLVRERLAARAEGKSVAPITVSGKLSGELKAAMDSGKLKINLGNDELNAKAKKALNNPELTLYKLQSKAYKLSFMLVPLSLPWLWLAFFWRRGVGMYDHAIFALYSISFVSLLFIAGSLALTLNITADWLWVSLLFAPAVHLFVQLRGAYGVGIWGATWRTAYLCVAAALTTAVYLMILVVIGVID